MSDELDLFGSSARGSSSGSSRRTTRTGTTARARNVGSLDAESASVVRDARAILATIPGASPESAVDVGALTETAKAVVEGALGPMWVRGEVTGFKQHRNGHWYFTLRDAFAQVRCVVWSRETRRIPASPDEGMQVVAYGQLTVYPARGELHFTVTALDAVGDGLWRKALEETRVRLERDGLLAPERKRPLPYHPRCIAVVTSPDGAAIRDVIAVLHRRSPGVHIVICAAKVQGDGAPEELCAALERVGRWGQADVVIIGRGGGGREDLWAFNHESVARAIAACPIPVIAAIGHEIDVTIADLVADLRAATPSAAAEAAVAVRADVLAGLAVRRERLVSLMYQRLDEARGSIVLAARDMRDSAVRVVERREGAVAAIAGRLNALSPLATLERGYAVARDLDDGRTLSTVADFVPGRTFQLVLRDGVVTAIPNSA